MFKDPNKHKENVIEKEDNENEKEDNENNQHEHENQHQEEEENKQVENQLVLLFGGAMTCTIPQCFIDVSTIRPSVPDNQEFFYNTINDSTIVIEIVEYQYNSIISDDNNNNDNIDIDYYNNNNNNNNNNIVAKYFFNDLAEQNDSTNSTFIPMVLSKSTCTTTSTSTSSTISTIKSATTTINFDEMINDDIITSLDSTTTTNNANNINYKNTDKSASTTDTLSYCYGSGIQTMSQQQQQSIQVYIELCIIRLPKYNTDIVITYTIPTLLPTITTTTNDIRKSTIMPHHQLKPIPATIIVESTSVSSILFQQLIQSFHIHDYTLFCT